MPDTGSEPGSGSCGPPAIVGGDAPGVSIWTSQLDSEAGGIGLGRLARVPECRPLERLYRRRPINVDDRVELGRRVGRGTNGSPAQSRGR